MTTNTEAPTIVVGVDASSGSAAAVTWADRYAEATGGRLLLLTAWAWPRMYGLPMVVDAWDPQGDAQRVLASAAAAASLPADRVETRVVEGVASTKLIEACAGADLLVVGSHGHGSDRSLLGSSASHGNRGWNKKNGRLN